MLLRTLPARGNIPLIVFGVGGSRSRCNEDCRPSKQEVLAVSDTAASIVPSGVPPSPQQFPFQLLMPQQPQPEMQLGATVVIKFFSEVNEATAKQLMQSLDLCVRQSVTDVLLLISSGGGSVHHGVSVYNYIRTVPFSVTTANFGSVDSIALVLFAAGKRRLSVPHARFLLHPVTTGLQSAPGQMLQLTEENLTVLLRGVRTDQANIAKIVAANSDRTAAQVLATMRATSILFPDDVKKWGLVHDITEITYPAGASLLTIQ